MSKLLAASLVDEIKSKVKLSELIGKDVKLMKAGREFKGLSPFQHENTPSFTVNDDKAFFHCFASGTHGDAIKWLQLYKGLGFRDAIVVLAGMAGVSIDTSTPGQSEERAKLLSACSVAARYWQNALWEEAAADHARRYLEERGVGESLAKRMGLGWSPPSVNGLRAALSAEGIRRGVAYKAGLFTQEGFGFFRDRLMFPVCNVQGRSIGFGGRRFENGPNAGPKYLNSRETPIFHKGGAFFGIDRALTSIAKSGQVVVVEGYMDAITMHRHSFTHTICSQGTAVSLSALRRALPQTHEFIFLLDGDKAGAAAMDRIVDDALAEAGPSCIVKFGILPEGADPDSFLQREDPASMQMILDTSVGLEEALWRRSLRKHIGDGPETRSALVQELIACADAIADEETRAWMHTGLARRIEQHCGPRRRLNEML